MFSDDFTYVAIALLILFAIDHLFWNGSVLNYLFNLIIYISAGIANWISAKLG